MGDLNEQGNYRIRQAEKLELDGLFFGGFADEYPTASTIKNTFAKEGYLMDTHTAVGRAVYLNYKHLMGDDTPTILAATAPVQVPADVLHAITRERQADAFAAAEELRALPERRCRRRSRS